MDFIMIISLISRENAEGNSTLCGYIDIVELFLLGKKYVENVYVYFLTAQGQSNISFPRVTG